MLLSHHLLPPLILASLVREEGLGVEAASHGAGGGGSPFWSGRVCAWNLGTGETGSVTSRSLPRLQDKADNVPSSL